MLTPSRSRVFERSAWLFLFASVWALWGATPSAWAQASQPATTSRPAGAAGASGGLESMPLRLRVQLVNGTEAQLRKEQGGGGAPVPLSDLLVRVFAQKSDGSQEELDSRTDATGNIDLDLGTRIVGTTVRIVAKTEAEDVGFLAIPIEVGQPIASVLPLYRLTRDPAQLEQGFLRVVTVQGEGDAQRVHIRQIVTLGHAGHEIFLGPEARPSAPTGFFPVPKGATLLSVEVNGIAAARLDLVDDQDWGHGWPMSGPLYPQTRIMGTYALNLTPGATFDVGVSAPIHTDSLVLAMEEGRFEFMSSSSDRTPTLQDAGPPITLPNEKQVCKPWQAREIPAKTTVRYVMRYRPDGQASSPSDDPEQIPFVLRLSLFDGTHYFQTGGPGTQQQGGHNHQGQSGEVRTLSSLPILVEVPALDGAPERIEAQTDVNGYLEVDLGTRWRGSRVVVSARVGGSGGTSEQWYQAIPFLIGSNFAANQLLYRCADDTSQFTQELMRVVTEQVGTGDEPPRVHVRQIQMVINPRHELVPARGADEEPAFFFPLPEGAELLTLSRDGEELAAPPAERHPAWGYGVPLRTAIYPQMRLMGTFRLPMEDGDQVDLGIQAPIRTARLLLALEGPRLQYLAGKEGENILLRDGGVSRPPGVSKECRQWWVPQIEPNTPVRAEVRYGRPPIKSRTYLLTLLIIGLVGAALVVGRLLATASIGRRSGNGTIRSNEQDTVAELERLDAQLARGEISEDGYRTQQEVLRNAVLGVPGSSFFAASAQPAVEPETLSVLRAIIERPNRTPEQAEEDFQVLSDAVRQYLVEPASRSLEDAESSL